MEYVGQWEDVQARGNNSHVQRSGSIEQPAVGGTKKVAISGE